MLTAIKNRTYLYGEKNNHIFLNRLQYKQILQSCIESVMREMIDDLVK